jgi:excisionase family DNA binding protein
MKPFSTEILSDYNLPLQCFHHLLYDSFMPWLPENSDSLRYRVLLTDLTNDNHHYFHSLLTAYKKRKIIPPPLLKKEWELFSHISLNQRATDIFKSLMPRRVSGTKIFFYYELNFYALLYSESLFILLMDKATDTLSRYLVNQWLKIIADLRQHIRQIYQTISQYDDTVILFFTDTALKVLEIEIQQLYEKYCPPALLIQSFNELKPRTDALEQDETIIHAVDEWFKDIYLTQFTGPDKPLKTTVSLSSSQTESDHSWEALTKRQTNASRVRQQEEESAPPAAEKEPRTDTDDMVIGSSEVRKILGIGKTKLWQMCTSGEIPHFRIGRLYRFNKSEILAFRKRLKA